jgi:phosphoserine phosphatase
VGRFQLCTLDCDGTLLKTTCFLEVAEAFGRGDHVRKLTEAYFAGQLSLREDFDAEFRALAGIPVEGAQAALRKGPWLRRIPEGVATLRGLGLRVGLLTDQPRFLASCAPGNLDPILCSEGGTQDGKISLPVDYKEDKAANLRAWCKANRVELDQVIHVGNGVNDLPVFERVGLSVAVNASGPDVARRADLAVEGAEDLKEIADVIERAVREG